MASGRDHVIRCIHSMPQLEQRQDALNDQLRDLIVAANRLGMYDAADYLKHVALGSSDLTARKKDTQEGEHVMPIKPVARNLIVLTLPRADKEPVLAHLEVMVNIATNAPVLTVEELDALQFTKELVKALENA